jgi:hypothetical protein
MTNPIKYLPLLLLFTGCGPETGVPPVVSITAPAPDTLVTGAVPVVIDAPEAARVELRARVAGSTGRGVLLGLSTSLPHRISAPTAHLPNGAKLEWLAEGRSSSGTTGVSQPLPVQVANSNTPALEYALAFTVPVLGPLAAATGPAAPLAALPSLKLGLSLSQTLAATSLRPPSCNPACALAPARAASTTAPQAALKRSLILELRWSPFVANDVQGYGLRLSRQGLVGPYDNLAEIATSNSNIGEQSDSRLLTAEIGDEVTGAVSVLRGPNLSESAYSNARSTRFLAPQVASSPNNDQVVPSGRPRFGWTTTPGAGGYVVYLFDRSPLEDGARRLWISGQQATSELATSYPSTGNPLAPGSYWWWVAGIAFGADGRATAFSLSDPRRLIVP